MKWLACVAVVIAAVTTGGAETPAPPPLPTVTSFTLPVRPDVFQQAKLSGSFKVLVTTDGTKVTDVREVAADRQEVRNHPLLANVLEVSVRAWRFAPHAAQSFELTLRARPRQSPDACRDSNWHVTLHLPIEVDLEYPPSCLVEYSTESIPGTLTVHRVRGVVRDEADASPVIDMGVDLNPNEVNHRTATTDARGTFDLGLLPPGKYSVDVGGWGYGHRSYTVVVNPKVSALVPLVLTLHKSSDYKPRPPWATVEETAVYPLELRDAGVSGEVRLQVDAGRQATVLDGPPGLTDAALRNLKTWQWRYGPTRSITVTYRYRLLPGDCTGDNGPFVSAQYPFEVDIAMKRQMPCGYF